ncbi:MAG: phosphoribosylformylglycinamidine synthase [Alphaproteobacteria bacterium]|nr:phosphoribosylformylglycinamidine synthase [Alphaproteobacteria bacterium]
MFRLEIMPQAIDGRAEALFKKLSSKFSVTDVQMIDVYTVDRHMFADDRAAASACFIKPFSPAPVMHFMNIKAPEDARDRYKADLKSFDWAFEIGFMPGVTDNIGGTAKELIENSLKIKFDEGEDVYSSTLYLVSGQLEESDINNIVASLSNSLIQRSSIKTYDDFITYGGMGVVVPKVSLEGDAEASVVNLEVYDTELEAMGSAGIKNADGTRRGPLGLRLDYMKAIQAYYRKIGRSPTDIELETLAQTWSEHCKHTIFASAIDDVKDGIYKHYIRRATKDIRAAKGKDDICVSVFKDNSGAIIFDDEWLVTDKVETHNTPSALDPFGGAITGIVGVNRDCIGFGQGAKPVINRYGFCLADPETKVELYRSKDKTNQTLSPEFIMHGVIEGVEAGGNCSGIPSPQGFLFFDDRYCGKPLVFAGTVGLIPREIKSEDGRSRPSHEKEAKAGDLIYMIGGRVGKDGIHGATFSSEALNEGSPVTAVQIGDPITQKKLSDAIVKEARDKLLYNSITDNGAGGLSSSVGEMAEESNGFELHLDKVPLKYPGLQPWEIWISESQERMTLAIPPENVLEFVMLMKKRGVEATEIGKFTGSGKAVVKYKGDVIMDLEMNFLHDGAPATFLKTKEIVSKLKEPKIAEPSDYEQVFCDLLSRPNLCGREFISSLYDHEVQANSIQKPLQGKGKVHADAAVSRPVLTSQKGVVTSQGLAPTYSDIDTYHMAASSIDTAVRAAVATGANIDHLAILDNFCWCSSNDETRLWQLKRAAEACYDYSTAYGTPLISGKDSMFNDFRGFDKKGNPVTISIPPTLLVSALGVVDDIEKTVSLDAKIAGDLVYVIGETYDELGGSEYYASFDELGANVPKVNSEKAADIYRKFYSAVKEDLIASSISLGIGGLWYGLTRTAMGGRLGLDVDISKASGASNLRADKALFSESQSRLLVTINPDYKERFESLMGSVVMAEMGVVTEDAVLKIANGTDEISNIQIAKLEDAYKSKMENF